MATKSILKTVEITDKKAAQQFTEALEKAVRISKTSIPDPTDRKCRELSKEEIKDFLYY